MISNTALNNVSIKMILMRYIPAQEKQEFPRLKEKDQDLTMLLKATA